MGWAFPWCVPWNTHRDRMALRAALVLSCPFPTEPRVGEWGLAVSQRAPPDVPPVHVGW
jgi:hypothetical protein